MAGKKLGRFLDILCVAGGRQGTVLGDRGRFSVSFFIRFQSLFVHDRILFRDAYRAVEDNR